LKIAFSFAKMKVLPFVMADEKNSGIWKKEGKLGLVSFRISKIFENCQFHKKIISQQT